ncbi:hypothetical protein [Alteromonas sp. S015]
MNSTLCLPVLITRFTDGLEAEMYSDPNILKHASSPLDMRKHEA